MTSDEPLTREERLDFLRQSIAFTEWTIRSFDTRAQISIVAFALSLSPVWTILAAACPRARRSLFVVILLILFATSVAMLALILVPFGVASTKTAVWPQKGLIYVGNANQITASVNTDRVSDVTDEAQLIEEMLHLARIRETKNRRFKDALRSAFVFYAWTVVTFLLLRNC